MSQCRATIAFACLLAVAAAASGCGSDDSGEETAARTGSSRPAPPKSVFPSAQGKSLAEVVKTADAPAETAVAPAALVFGKGENRYPFGVFEPDRSQIDDAKVALYIAKSPPLKPQKSDGKKRKGAVARALDEALDEPAMGPFPASIESIATKPAFRAKTTTDSDATVVYSSQIDFPSEGEWRIAAMIREDDGQLASTLLSSAVVGEFKRIPEEGERPPAIHTPTAEDVGGDLAKITTRIPPDTQNKVDFADVLGKKPIVLLFATPQFCQSRVCGPVVDVAEQVKETYGGEAEFIHMEIFNDNDPSKDVRPQVAAFHLPTEPWAFVIGADGTVDTAIEGAFGVERLTEALEGASG